jgi:hypothetical protein
MQKELRTFSTCSYFFSTEKKLPYILIFRNLHSEIFRAHESTRITLISMKYLP